MSGNTEYVKGYADGFAAGIERSKREDDKPYLTVDDIIKRYDGKIGINKAGEIMRAVRRLCGGGKLDSCSLILRSEMEYWESIIDKEYKPRL